MASIPSIAMIPSGYKATKVYSVLPVDGSADLTFARAGVSGAANRVASNGLIEEMATDVPRLDYLDGSCPSLLLEPQSTNLVTYSEEFDNAAWSSSLIADTANQAISPKGDLTADLLTIDTSAGNHYQYFDTSVSALTTYTNSVFVKAGTSDFAYISINQRNAGFVGEASFVFQFSTETLGSAITGATPPTDLSADWDNYGNGWYRISITGTTTSGVTTNRINVGIAQSLSVITHTGNGTDTIYVWGAQVEEQSYATSYIPTSGGVTATRIADTCSKTGLGSYINSSEGVLYAEISSSWEGTSGVKGISLYNGSEYVSIYLRDNNSLSARVVSGGGANTYQLDTTYAVNQYYKVAFKYKANDLSLWVNGVEVDVNSTAPTMPTGLSILSFDRAGSFEFEGKVKDLRVYDTALTDAELTTLTT